MSRSVSQARHAQHEPLHQEQVQHDARDVDDGHDAEDEIDSQKPSLPDCLIGLVVAADARGDHLEAGQHVVA